MINNYWISYFIFLIVPVVNSQSLIVLKSFERNNDTIFIEEYDSDFIKMKDFEYVTHNDEGISLNNGMIISSKYNKEKLCFECSLMDASVNRQMNFENKHGISNSSFSNKQDYVILSLTDVDEDWDMWFNLFVYNKINKDTFRIYTDGLSRFDSGNYIDGLEYIAYVDYSPRGLGSNPKNEFIKLYDYKKNITLNVWSNIFDDLYYENGSEILFSYPVWNIEKDEFYFTTFKHKSKKDKVVIYRFSCANKSLKKFTHFSIGKRSQTTIFGMQFFGGKFLFLDNNGIFTICNNKKAYQVLFEKKIEKGDFFVKIN